MEETFVNIICHDSITAEAVQADLAWTLDIKSRVVGSELLIPVPAEGIPGVALRDIRMVVGSRANYIDMFNQYPDEYSYSCRQCYCVPQ